MRAEGPQKVLSLGKFNRTFNDGWGIKLVLLKNIYPCEDSVETSKDNTDNKHECSEIKQETIEQSLKRVFTVRRLGEK